MRIEVTGSSRPRKGLGQHFLYDPAIAGKIVESSSLEPGKVVIELGAGRGILTRPLYERSGRLIALEIDRELVERLECSAVQWAGDRAESRPVDGAGPKLPSGLEILQADFTRLSLTGLLAARGFDRCFLFGNIPYNLTRHVLFYFLVDEFEVIERCLLLLQREVAERIVSREGSRIYGVTSVVLQSLYEAKILFKVAPGSFRPPPRVESALVQFTPREEPLVEGDDLGGFIGFIKNLFQQRRKTLKRVLRNSYSFSEETLEELQAATAIDLKNRPEDLTKEEFLKLYENINALKKV